jgi:predicted kinase
VPAEHLDARLIVFSGLPGTGKSELAGHLARALGLPLLSVDPIEAALLRAGLTRSFATGLGAYLVVEALADSQLALGQSVIVDAVNSVDAAKDMWRALAIKHEVRLDPIECQCSDEDLHRARLASRRRHLPPEFAEPTWDDVLRRREESTPWSEPLLAVDAAQSVDSNTKLVLSWLRRRGIKPGG